MSSMVRLTETQDIGLLNNNGATYLEKNTTRPQSEEATIDLPLERNESPRPQLTFKSLTMKDLCMELDKCTKETQKLQEELENATKVTLGRFGDAHTDCLSNVCGALVELVQNQMAQQMFHNLESSDRMMFSPSAPGYSEKIEFENAMGHCNQQLCSTEINKASVQQEVCNPAMNLQTQLDIVQMDKDIVSDLRLKDSKKHAEDMEKMLHILEEVQVTKRRGDQRLEKTQKEALLCYEQQQHELQEEVKTLRGQLKVAWEQLHRTGEEKTCLQTLLQQKTQEGKKSQELLKEKKVELELRHQTSQQHMASLFEARAQCQKLHTETEDLRMKLEDKEKIIEILRLQLESCIQKSAQHSLSIDNLHQENMLLNNQIKQDKLEILHLEAKLHNCKSSVATAEHEKWQLQASVAEQNCRFQEETLAKQQLTIELDKQCLQIATLTEEHKKLQQLYSCKNKENEGVLLKLQSHLKNVQGELDQVRSILRTLQRTDGHGFKVALSMQKEITDRRKQVDSLQSKIQHLEESKEKLSQEKLYQILENKHQFQELALFQNEKKQLAKELEDVKLKDKHLRERISDLEAVLHKMFESFADCQDLFHLREQEFYCLKLKNALDWKGQHCKNLYSDPKFF